MANRKSTTRQTPVVKMTDVELSADIAEWDAARDMLDKAGTAAHDAQGTLAALPADATAEDRQAAQHATDAAELAVTEAKAAIEALKPLPEEAAAAMLSARQNQNTPEGSGTAREASGGQPLPIEGDVGDLQHGTQPAPQPQISDVDRLFLEEIERLSAEQGITREELLNWAIGVSEVPVVASDLAEGSSAHDVHMPDPAEMFADTQAMLASMIGDARSDAAAGDVEAAVQTLVMRRDSVAQALLAFEAVIAGLDTEISIMRELQVSAPVEHAVRVVAKVDSRWRIGRQFTKAHTYFEVGELSASEFEALNGDPLLTVSEG